MANYDVFQLGNIVLQCGITLPQAKLAYKTYGKLSASGDNAVVMPTAYSGRHTDNELMIGAGRALDPAQWFIIVPNMFGNGLSSSPSNTAPPFERAAFPRVSLYDNVVCQHRLVTEHLGIDRVRLVVGFSMGAQQAFQRGALHPDVVRAIAPVCGSARTSPHNYLFLSKRSEVLRARRGTAIAQAPAGIMKSGISTALFICARIARLEAWPVWTTTDGSAESASRALFVMNLCVV